MHLTQTLDPLNLLSVSDLNGIKKNFKSPSSSNLIYYSRVVKVLKKYMLINDELIMTHSARHLC